LVAAALATRDLADRPRAVRVLRAVIEADPRAQLAFERVRILLNEGEEWAVLAEVLVGRLPLEKDARRAVALRIELGRLYRDRLGDPARAREELSAALALDANAPEAISLLADVEEGEGHYAEAAELLLRRARVERSRPDLAQQLYRLGVIYGRHLGDPKKAIACVARVLQVEPNHKDALELLADCCSKEWDWKGALAALQRLVALEVNGHRRVALLHRAAKIQEEGFKEPRQALALYRAALEVDPLYLPAVEALGRFFDRQSDVQSLRILCDTTARRVRAAMKGGATDLDGFRTIYQLSTLRHAPDRAAISAGVLEWALGPTNGTLDTEEKKALERLRTREQYPGSALADSQVDDHLFDARVPASIRALLRLVDEPLRKAARADVKQLGLSKNDRLPKSGHAVRDLANRIAADLGIRDFDVYVAASLARNSLLEITDPPSLCFGAELIDGAHELQLRFVIARLFKMAQLELSFAMRMPSETLAVQIAAVVRQFVTDFTPAGVDAAQLVAETARMQKVLPRKILGELHAIALECATPNASLAQVGDGITAAADRAGLLACGAPGPALSMLVRMRHPEAAAALARFAVGDELPELRRIVGTSIG
jgi:tetratricopeptide (TPR) repeat protein